LGYDEKTEVLTKNGWKFLKDLTIRDECATLNPRTHEFEWQKIEKITVKRYSGEMYCCKTKYVDLLVTPDHKMYVCPYKKCTVDSTDKFKLIEARDVFNTGVHHITTAARWRGEEKEYFTLPECKTKTGCRIPKKEIPMMDWVEFFGYYIAEGCIWEGGNGHYRIVIVQRSENFEKIYDAFHRIGMGKIKIKSNPHYPHVQHIIMHNLQLYSYLSRFGKSYDKWIPIEIKNLSSKYLKIFFDAYISGDGLIKSYKSGSVGIGVSISAWTSSKKLRDDLQEIGIKLGYGVQYKLDCDIGKSHYVKSIGRTITAKHKCWVIYFSPRKTPYFNQKHNERIAYSRKKKTLTEEKNVHYSGKIYSLDVPNNIILVRRNGKCFFSGSN